MLNWIARNRTVWHLNCVLMLNWIIWNKTVLALTLCIIHQLHLSRGVRPPPLNEYLVYDTKDIWWWVSSDAGALGDAEHPFIAIVPRSTLGAMAMKGCSGMVTPDQALSMG